MEIIHNLYIEEIALLHLQLSRVIVAIGRLRASGRLVLFFVCLFVFADHSKDNMRISTLLTQLYRPEITHMLL